MHAAQDASDNSAQAQQPVFFARFVPGIERAFSDRTQPRDEAPRNLLGSHAH